jgi:predicted Ser/Thr protein kinase
VIRIKLYAGLNIKELEFLGSGTQGKVYRIDSQKCIKIFKRERVCKEESKTLVMAQIDLHFPRFYENGKDYIIRECINGIDLEKYLSTNPLTPSVSNKIMELYDAIMRVGYNRLDTALFHIFIIPSGELRLIDTSKALKKRAIYPASMLRGLEELGYKKQFLNHVKITRPDLYMKWLP